MHASDIFGSDEIQTVLDDLDRRRRRFTGTWQNKIIFRLSTCCGLRRKEIAGLNLADFNLAPPRPEIRIRKEITKANSAGVRKARRVPLWWDSGTLTDLLEWHEHRKSMGAGPNDPFVCSLRRERLGGRMRPDRVAKRFKTAIAILGPARVSQLSVHDGRHSFCSHALAGGISLVGVRDAAGHANIATTNIYLHAVDDDVSGIFSKHKFDVVTDHHRIAPVK